MAVAYMYNWRPAGYQYEILYAHIAMYGRASAHGYRARARARRFLASSRPGEVGSRVQPRVTDAQSTADP